jgi:hypothetical protein
MLTGPPRRRRARPVADAPIDALLSQSEDLAKGWLLALLERAPLDEVPRIMATDLTRDGPRVCEAMLRALAYDADERHLEGDGALAPLAGRIGELAGASGAEATAHAVDALQAIIWAAIRAELHDPDPDLITALAERLAQVAELMRAAALRRSDDAPRPPMTAVRPGVRDPLAAYRGGPVGHPVITDQRLHDLRVARRPLRPETPPPPVAGRDSPLRASVSGDDGTEGLWIAALEDEIKDGGGAPLSLILAELEDADKVVAVENRRIASATLGGFAKAVRGAVRKQDILVCETDARAWVILRDTGRVGAQALGMRISVAVRESRTWRGAPMAASVGVAVLGEDGGSPSELIEAAEEARFAAAASGVDIVRDGEESD